MLKHAVDFYALHAPGADMELSAHKMMVKDMQRALEDVRALGDPDDIFPSEAEIERMQQ